MKSRLGYVTGRENRWKRDEWMPCPTESVEHGAVQIAQSVFLSRHSVDLADRLVGRSGESLLLVGLSVFLQGAQGRNGFLGWLADQAEANRRRHLDRRLFVFFEHADECRHDLLRLIQLAESRRR